MLCGGRTPTATYRRLSQPPFQDRIPWQAMEFYWGDERCVPADDDRNNALTAFRTLLDHVPVPPQQIHPVQCDGSPAAAAQRYEQLLRTRLSGPMPVLDIVLLGLGEDGHTASLFPGSAILKEKERWAAAVYSEAEAMHRISMTPVLLNQTLLVVFLVTGRKKAPILKQVREGPYDPLNWPAQSIRPHKGERIWLVDQAAASALA
ncbi:6-phosphogluconolactonase [Desulfatitalea sp. M08but]|uniref:6-phosphogluconolactonase n=1 Tax=Desulfatitalea alkaliphila TaxID=2929485 RepID=A0AA41R1B8_9BACT|nr:6-phosphogluconolactonase [Desulfatitalea alkaliphila]